MNDPLESKMSDWTLSPQEELSVILKRLEAWEEKFRKEDKLKVSIRLNAAIEILRTSITWI